MRRLILTVLPLLLAGAFVVSGCGDDDLTVAVADDVRGARIDAAPGADVEAGTPPNGTSSTGTPDAVEGPEIAQPDEPLPAAVPDEPQSPATEPTPQSGDESGDDSGDGTGDDPGVAGGDERPEPEPEAGMPLGDLPTAGDEVKPPAVDEPEDDGGADESEGGQPLDIPIPDPDDWKPEPPKLPVLKDGEWHTSFDYLGSFDCGFDAIAADSPLAQHTPKTDDAENVEGAAEPEKGIPEAVHKMDGQKVRIEGYMIPLKFEDGAVKTFFLSRYMMGCCFGVLPKANEIIEVEMAGEKGTYYDAYMPFVVIGTFEVVEEGTSPEFLQSVFRIKADACDYAEDW